MTDYSRRVVATRAAWALPALSVATAAPSMASSGTPKALNLCAGALPHKGVSASISNIVGSTAILTITLSNIDVSNVVQGYDGYSVSVVSPHIAVATTGGYLQPSSVSATSSATTLTPVTTSLTLVYTATVDFAGLHFTPLSNGDICDVTVLQPDSPTDQFSFRTGAVTGYSLPGTTELQWTAYQAGVAAEQGSSFTGFLGDGTSGGDHSLVGDYTCDNRGVSLICGASGG